MQQDGRQNKSAGEAQSRTPLLQHAFLNVGISVKYGEDSDQQHADHQRESSGESDEQSQNKDRGRDAVIGSIQRNTKLAQKTTDEYRADKRRRQKIEGRPPPIWTAHNPTAIIANRWSIPEK